MSHTAVVKERFVKLTAIMRVPMVFIFLAGPLNGKTYLTQSEALATMFPEVDGIVQETSILTDQQLNQLREKLYGSEKRSVAALRQCTIHYGEYREKRIGAALIVSQDGKWGEIRFIIRLDPVSAVVQNLAVLSSSEKRGRPITRRGFLSQFIGKGRESKLILKEDIRAISGATISSDAARLAVKTAISLYEVVVLNSDL